MLTTSVIGSYAWPSWYVTAVDAIRRGDYGPDDIEETLNDAVDLAVRDQERAGVDLITDGEMRRFGFFTAGFYGRLTGLEARAARRRVGPAGHDQRERYDAVDPIKAPEGLGLVAEYAYVTSRTKLDVKVPCPGPYTLAGRILPGRHYADRMEVADRLAEIVNAELRALVAAGVDVIQLDEPSFAVHKHSPEAFVALFNKTVKGVKARTSLHLCFGNFVGRPVAQRTYRPLFPHILDTEADELALEFANREMAEIELVQQVAEAGKDVAAGLIDVKNYFVETPEIVSDRIRHTLKHISPQRLTVTPDCGFSQTARWAARAKLHAMVAGTRLVRRRLSGAPL